jgi:hypothetical protein
MPFNYEWATLRTKSSMKVKSGFSQLDVQMTVKFTDDFLEPGGSATTSNGYQKLRALIAQFRTTPFCYVENQYQSACAAGSWEYSEAVYSHYQCQQCSYCGVWYRNYGWYNGWYYYDYYYCGEYIYYDCYCYHVYDYYYSCSSWNYVEFPPEETAHTLSFNIEAGSHGALVGSITDNNWFCEVEEASLIINGNKIVD